MVPLNPTSIVTIAPAGSVGTTGAIAGVVPRVITSGSYTANFPVAGSRIVACTKAPRLAELAVVQPDAAGVIPPAPVSCHGVARPAALSGSAGTMMSQLTFAAATTGVVAVALGVALGQGVATTDVVGVADAVGVADTVAIAVADTVGVGVGCGRHPWCLLWRDGSLVADTTCVPATAAVAGVADTVVDGAADAAVAGVADAVVDGVADAAVAGVADAAVDGAADAVVDDVADAAAEGVAQAPCAERLRLPGPPISFRPRINPTTSARATGTATLAARALRGRADQCALRIQSTSVFAVVLSNGHRRPLQCR